MIIERIVRNYLADALDYPVTFSKQKEPPERFYILEKTGSSEENFLPDASFAIQSYAPKIEEAMEMSKAAVEAVRGMIELDEIRYTDAGNDYNFTEPDVNQPRYQAAFEVGFYS